MKKYKVKNDLDYIPDPEESLILPVDEKLRLGRLMTGKFFRWIYIATFLFFTLIFGLVFNLEILQGNDYLEQSFGNQYASFPLRPSRGTIYDRGLNILADNFTEYDLIIKRNSKDNLQEISQILNGDYSELNSLFETGNDTFVAIEDITVQQAEKIKKENFSDTYMVEKSARKYNDGEIFSHLIGYVSEVNEKNIEDGYRAKDFIGKSGIELVYENYLKGNRGYFKVSRIFQSEPIITEPSKGSDVILSIDSELQKVLFDKLNEGLKIAGSKKGVGIVQNPNTGEILAMVSLPSFDNHALTNGISGDEYSKLINNDYKPLLNRAIGGRFSPGSTIKPLFALAVLQEDLIDPNTRIHTTGSISVVSPYDPNVVYTFNDWRNHGSVNFFEAIANSVDVYFYILGGGYKDIEGLGIDRMSSYLKQFRADEILGVDLPGEISGLVPTRDFKERLKGEPWYVGDSYNVSIGQGDLLVTPLWINTYISAIANGGKIYKPFVVSRIIDSEGDYARLFNGEVISEINLDEEKFDLVKKGMRMAVTQGTIKRYLDGLPVSIAAKTGTAEVVKGKTTNSFVTLFAPYENPEISMTILVEDAQEALSIAPFVARNVLEWYFTRPAVSRQLPAENQFRNQFISE